MDSAKSLCAPNAKDSRPEVSRQQSWGRGVPTLWFGPEGIFSGSTPIAFAMMQAISYLVKGSFPDHWKIPRKLPR